MVLFRYYAKEVFTTLAAVTLILVLVFLSNQFVRYLGEAALGRLAGNMLLEVTALAIPHLLGLLLPLAFYLALLLALGRLYSDSEITVMNACGLGQWQLMRYTWRLALVIFVVVATLNLWVTPKLLLVRDKLLADAGLSAIVQTMLPGRFQAGPDGKHIFYLARLSRDRSTMQDLFMAELVNSQNSKTHQLQETWSVLSAASGRQQLDQSTNSTYIVAHNGNRYYGISGNRDYRVAHFAEYGVRVVDAPPVLKARDEATLPTTLLWLLASGSHPRLVAELQWRLSMPISVFLLALIAVPLARVGPRKGRYSKLLPGILVCIVYANLLFLSRAWLQKGLISSTIGMWWVQGVLLLLGAILWGPTFLRYVREKTR